MTTKELRTHLYSAMLDLRSGKITTKEAGNTAKLAAQIIYAKRVDIEEANLNYKVSKTVAKNSKVTATLL